MVTCHTICRLFKYIATCHTISNLLSYHHLPHHQSPFVIYSFATPFATFLKTSPLHLPHHQSPFVISTLATPSVTFCHIATDHTIRHLLPYNNLTHHLPPFFNISPLATPSAFCFIGIHPLCPLRYTTSCIMMSFFVILKGCSLSSNNNVPHAFVLCCCLLSRCSIVWLWGAFSLSVCFLSCCHTMQPIVSCSFLVSCMFESELTTSLFVLISYFIKLKSLLQRSLFLLYWFCMIQNINVK